MVEKVHVLGQFAIGSDDPDTGDDVGLMDIEAGQRETRRPYSPPTGEVRAPEDIGSRNNLLCVLPGDRGDNLGVRGGVRVRLTRGLEAPVFNDLVPRGQHRAYVFPPPFSSSWMLRRGIETDTN